MERGEGLPVQIEPVASAGENSEGRADYEDLTNNFENSCDCPLALEKNNDNNEREQLLRCLKNT